MNETKIEDDQRYKLLSEGERRFLEIPESELEVHYKRPDLAKKQFLLKIKYRAINAIKEIAWLCDKLHEDQLKKIFSDNRILELFKISGKALDAAEWRPDITKWQPEWSVSKSVLSNLEILSPSEAEELNRKLLADLEKEPKEFIPTSARESLLAGFIEKLQKHLMPEAELKALKQLLKDYFTPQNLLWKIKGYESKLSEYQKAEKIYKEAAKRRDDFIKSHNLQEAFKTFEEKWLREDMKKSGVPDNEIQYFFDKKNKREQMVFGEAPHLFEYLFSSHLTGITD